MRSAYTVLNAYVPDVLAFVNSGGFKTGWEYGAMPTNPSRNFFFGECAPEREAELLAINSVDGPFSIGIQRVRQSVNTIAPSTTSNISISIPVQFYDTNFTVVATAEGRYVEDGGGSVISAGKLRVLRTHIGSVNMSVTVDVINDDPTYGSYGTMHLIAIHDEYEFQ